jgi:hypothetical protein
VGYGWQRGLLKITAAAANGSLPLNLHHALIPEKFRVLNLKTTQTQWGYVSSGWITAKSVVTCMIVSGGLTFARTILWWEELFCILLDTCCPRLLYSKGQLMPNSTISIVLIMPFLSDEWHHKSLMTFRDCQSQGCIIPWHGTGLDYECAFHFNSIRDPSHTISSVGFYTLGHYPCH